MKNGEYSSQVRGLRALAGLPPEHRNGVSQGEALELVEALEAVERLQGFMRSLPAPLQARMEIDYTNASIQVLDDPEKLGRLLVQLETLADKIRLDDQLTLESFRERQNDIKKLSQSWVKAPKAEQNRRLLKKLIRALMALLSLSTKTKTESPLAFVID